MSESIPSLVDFSVSLPSSLLSGVLDDEITLDSELEKVTGNNKLQRAVITCFPPDLDTKWLLPNTYFHDTSIIKNWCGQFEMTPETNRIHFHIYVEFDHAKKPRFNTLKRAFTEHFDSTVNITKPKHRASKKSQSCSANYVLAPDKRAPETKPYIWEHNKDKLSFDEKLWGERTQTSKPSKEDKDKLIIDYIESKPKHWDWNSIVHENTESKYLLGSCSWGSKFHAGRHAEVPRRTIANVIILYGAGGTGKSTLARNWDVREGEDLEERYFLRNYDDGHF